jgi:hypothetical protein
LGQKAKYSLRAAVSALARHPNNGHRSIGSACPFGATTGLMQRSKSQSYSISSSAMLSKFAGTVRPSVLAVPRLMKFKFGLLAALWISQLPCSIVTEARFARVSPHGAGYLGELRVRIDDELVCGDGLNVFIILRGPPRPGCQLRLTRCGKRMKLAFEVVSETFAAAAAILWFMSARVRLRKGGLAKRGLESGLDDPRSLLRLVYKQSQWNAWAATAAALAAIFAITDGFVR